MTDPFSVVIFVAILLFSVILHEVAHGLMADRLGDPTARYSGRLTLNPIPHIDPLWSVIIPLAMKYFHFPFLFGAAKPVPVNFQNLRNPKRDMILVSIAGPAVNIALAFCAGIIFRFTPNLSIVGEKYLLETVALNLILALFNMIPVPPLDGSKVLAGILGYFDRNWMYDFLQLERYGFIMVLVLLYVIVSVPAVSILIGAPFAGLFHLFTGLNNIPANIF